MSLLWKPLLSLCLVLTTACTGELRRPDADQESAASQSSTQSQDDHGHGGSSGTHGSSSGDADTGTSAGGDSDPAIDPPLCAEEGTACASDGGACCEGLVCLWHDYVSSTCVRLLLGDGQACETDEACQSGRCRMYECTSECLALDTWGCEVGANDCCEGVCLDGGYGWGNCGAPKPDGEWCWTGESCASGHCTTDYVCGPQPEPCVATGAWGCEVGAGDCCEGVCHDGGYGWGECGAPRQTGEWCWSSQSCASGICDTSTGTCQ
jgi:hypothetical protein